MNAMKIFAAHKALLWATLIGVCLGLAACSDESPSERTDESPPEITGESLPERTKTVMHDVSVRLTWLHQASYVPFHVAKAKGFYAEENINLTINPSGPDVRPVTTVISGEDEFGVEGASAIIQAAASNLPVRIIGTYLHRSPEVFMVRKGSGLADVRKWRGQRVGVWVGTHVEPLFEQMLARMGMKRDDVTVVPARFDIAPFLATGDQRVPIWNAYIYNEAQVAIAKGVEIEVVTPESVGIDRVGEGIFVRTDYLTVNREVVDGFLRATARGIEYAAKNQQEAISILTSGEYGEDFDIPHQTQMLAAAAPLMFDSEGVPLTISRDAWLRSVSSAFLIGEQKEVDITALLVDQPAE